MPDADNAQRNLLPHIRLLPDLRREQRDPQKRQTQVSIGSETLGEPASIRIVEEREKGPGASLGFRRVSLQDGATPTYDDLLRDFAEQNPGREKAKPESYILAIGQIYYRWIRDLPQQSAPTAAQCKSLGLELYNGFELGQLVEYLRKAKEEEVRSIASDNLEGRGRMGNYKRSRWYYGTSDFPTVSILRLNSRNRVGLDVDESFLLVPGRVEEDGTVIRTHKLDVVEAILRDVWLIRALEETQSVGEIEIQIFKEEYLDVLSRQGMSIAPSRN